MASRSKIEFLSINKANYREDATGIYLVSNPNAYGGSNVQIASIDSVIVGLQQYFERRKYKIKFTSNPNPNNPFEFHHLPFCRLPQEQIFCYHQ